MTLAFANSKMPPLRALLVLCIVLGHFSYYGVPALGPLRSLAVPAVAMFLFISGYGLTRSWQLKGAAYLRGFFGRRIVRIALPAALVALLHRLLTGGFAGLPHFWFVWTILFDYLLFWLCRKFLPEKAAPWAILAGVLLFAVGTAAAGFDRCWWISALAFPGGAFLAEYEDAFFGFCRRREANWWLALLASAAVAAGLFLTGNLACKALCYVFSSLACALLVARIPLDGLRLQVLAWLGSISYELYLVHITVMLLLQGSFSGLAFVALTLAVSVAAAFALRLLCQLITHN